MAREAMKELVRATVKCTDENLGRWLSVYQKGRLGERERALFVGHLCECLHCMALYNIETKHKHGYINPERTSAGRIKIGLLEGPPSGAHILAALAVWVVAVSLGLMQTAHPRMQEAIAGPNMSSSAPIAQVQTPSQSEVKESGRAALSKVVPRNNSRALAPSVPAVPPAPTEVTTQANNNASGSGGIPKQACGCDPCLKEGEAQMAKAASNHDDKKIEERITSPTEVSAAIKLSVDLIFKEIQNTPLSPSPARDVPFISKAYEQKEAHRELSNGSGKRDT